MKVTLAFLFLGICLALSNARYVERKRMSEAEAYSNGRMMSLVIKRWNDWQNCHKCSDAERYCMEKAIVEDICFIVRLMTNDMGCTLQQFLGKAKFQFHATVVIKTIETNDIDTLTKTLRAHGMINNFVQSVCGLMNAPLKESNVDMGGILNSVNSIVGGGISAALGLLGGATNAITGVVGGLTNTVGGLTNTVGGLSNTVGGLTNTVGGLTNTAGGLLGGLTNAATGVAGGLTNAATGVVGGLANTAGGLVGGLANTAGGLVGGVTNGLLGGLGGLLGGGKKG